MGRRIACRSDLVCPLIEAIALQLLSVQTTSDLLQEFLDFLGIV